MDATLIERNALRMTPAGAPVLELRLQHQSDMVEGGIARRLDFPVDAIAIGKAARELAEVGLGEHLHVVGFLAPRGRRSTRLRVHVLDYSRVTRPAGASRGNENG